MAGLKVWGFDLPVVELGADVRAYLGALPVARPTVEWVWAEMDRIWRDFGLDNRNFLSKQPIAAYYSHPVWTMNGIFTATDPVSVGHRTAIASHLVALHPARVADYGGGFGELALAIAVRRPETRVDIVEPFPSPMGVARVAHLPQVGFVRDTGEGGYDAMIAQDVLEHVEDPIGLAAQLAESVRPGGWLIFANCFFPVIECHLPRTFFLRHTFRWVMEAMGLRFLGVVRGAEHALVFERRGELDPTAARRAEGRARLIGPFLNFPPLNLVLRGFKKLLRG